MARKEILDGMHAILRNLDFVHYVKVEKKKTKEKTALGNSLYEGSLERCFDVSVEKKNQKRP